MVKKILVCFYVSQCITLDNAVRTPWHNDTLSETIGLAKLTHHKRI